MYTHSSRYEARTHVHQVMAQIKILHSMNRPEYHPSRCQNERFIEWFGPTIEGQHPRTPAQRQAADQWYDKTILSESYLAIVIPGMYRDQSGAYMLFTSAESMQVETDNIRALQLVGYIINPSWLYMDMYWFASNISTKPVDSSVNWSPGIWIGTMKQVLDNIFQRKGQQHWRLEYCILEPMPHTSHEDYLRNIIWQAFNAKCIVEFRIELSSEWFRGIEVRMRVTTPRYAEDRPSTHELKYILGCSQDIWDREDKDAGDWWRYEDWHNLGQVPMHPEWILEDTYRRARNKRPRLYR